MKSFKVIIWFFCISLLLIYCENGNFVSNPNDVQFRTDYQVDIPSVPKINIYTQDSVEITSKEEWVYASINIPAYPDSTSANYIQSVVQIKGRGNSTWEYPKIPYSLKFEKKKSLLNLPKGKKWVLLANYRDKTLLRNAIAFEISKKTSLKWTPRSEFVDLYINDEYRGNYLLCEKITISKNRVDIDEDEGYLFELDITYDEEWKFKTDIKELPVMIKDPDINQEKLEEVKEWFNSVESIIYSEKFSDEEEGYAKYIDINSFVDWFLVHELMGCCEPNHPKSVYMYKDKGESKLIMGPVWDFDWITCINSEGLNIKNAIWYSRLFEDDRFAFTVKNRWNILKDSLSNLHEFIDQKGAFLEESQKLNCERWDLENIDLIGVNYSTYGEYLEALKNYFDARIEWLDGAIGAL